MFQRPPTGPYAAPQARYKTKEIAASYGVTTFTVLKWIRTGQLRAVRRGRRYYVRPSDIAEFELAHAVRTNPVTT